MCTATARLGGMLAVSAMCIIKPPALPTHITLPAQCKVGGVLMCRGSGGLGGLLAVNAMCIIKPGALPIHITLLLRLGWWG
jgi:hypothetical protein